MPQTWIYGKVEHNKGQTTYRLRYDEIISKQNYIDQFESMCRMELKAKTSVCTQLSIITLEGGHPLTNWCGDEIPAEIIFTIDRQSKTENMPSMATAIS